MLAKPSTTCYNQSLRCLDPPGSGLSSLSVRPLAVCAKQAAVARIGRDQRFERQIDNDIGDVEGLPRSVGHDLLGSLQRETAHEDRQSPESRFLLGPLHGILV